MKRNNTRGMLTGLAVCFLLFVTLCGRAAAQNDPAYVIFRGDFYLAHVWDDGSSQWTIQGVTTFNPNCIWYSPNTNNYYFFDEHNANAKRYLDAERSSGASISTTITPGNLDDPDGHNYFYNWDWGLARGVRTYISATADAADHCDASDVSDNGKECWTVYWVSYDNGWKMSDDKSYNPVPTAAVFRAVRITEHPDTYVNISGGIGNLSDFAMEYNDNHPLSVTISDYGYDRIPAYTTYLIGDISCNDANWTARKCDTTWQVHNYYGDADHRSTIPDTVKDVDISSSTATYAWTITGDGAAHLSFESGSDELTSSAAAPTVYYRTANKSGDKTATLTLTVTYSDGSTQTRTATITVTSECGNPRQAAAPVVDYDIVIVSWLATSTDYDIYYKKYEDDDWTVISNVGNVTTHLFSGLEYSTLYYYKVIADCDPADGDVTVYEFTTHAEPGAMVYGSVFGGGRMADVGGKTEVIVINCDTLSAIFGGNDIAGDVLGNSGADGSTVTIGVNADDPNDYDDYGVTTGDMKIGSVYGGGNGYYAYNGTSFTAASDTYSSQAVAAAGAVKTMTRERAVGETVWTNGSSATTLTFPTIAKTVIVVNNDYAKIDSVFGGAKNAFISNTSGDNTLVTINGGTIYSVFGGNNIGGTLGAGSTQHVVINNTKTDLTALAEVNTPTTGFGRDFGIRYIFGGGNSVAGRTVNLQVLGGQCDTVFGGGNAEDVGTVNVSVNCALGDPDGTWTQFGSVITKGIYSYSAPNITIDRNYVWSGKGVYNVRALFGGNNAADMSQIPTITLSSGHVCTVYGGGNSGRMLADATDNGSGGSLTINNQAVKYGTHVVTPSDSKILVDFLYGGCQKSDVAYSTWVEMKGGYVGTIYGGCNISGDVGSTRTDMSDGLNPGDLNYQKVQGGTYVVASGGTVYKNIFAGSNGFYHCNNYVKYISGINYDDEPEYYIGLTIPTHNETTVLINDGANVNGNVYAGGNLANVGFNTRYASAPERNMNYPISVGMATVLMSGGTVAGDVYGGGNMAPIYGNNEVKVSGGTIGGALYGGNDRAGKVGGESNRQRTALLASDGETSISEIKTYVEVSGIPRISTVYGGGNGDYDYTENSDIPLCENAETPVQGNTFVDIHIKGGDTTGYHQKYLDGDLASFTGGGFISNVYGGGDGVTVREAITVFVNLVDADAHDNVGIIYGGNNKGDLELLPNIILYKGQVNTIYGGCNQGAMTGSFSVNGGDYTSVGSLVHLLGTYNGHTVTGSVSGAVYGGCRLNGVTNNSLVLVDGGTHTASMFGGSDISGTISGLSQVVVNGGTVGAVYGGGNGDYLYDHTNRLVKDKTGTVELAIGDYNAPVCTNSQVDILGGNVGTLATATTADVVFGGGLGQGTSITTNTTVNIGPASGTPTLNVYGNIYGGSALGEVNTTTVNVLNGHSYSNIFGGGLGDTTYALIGGTANIHAMVNGNVVVNIGQDNGDGTYSGNATVDGIVFGGNNNNGAPAGTVNVNVYKTAHTLANTVPTDAEIAVEDVESTWPNAAPEPGSSDEYYALKGVYGGGNLAHKWSTGLTTVHIYGCDNSVKYVYGGAKAADLAGSDAVIVDGGHIYQVFGGGDGADVHHMPNGGDTLARANIAGNATTTINGGYIHYAFGGSNTRGNISGTQSITIDDEGSCFGPILVNFFAGGNLAETTTELLETTINNCDVKFVNFYGGANQAKITGNVRININGGTYYNIFGGSKSAPIIGNVTVNFHGGKVTNIFGGNNTSGQISGNIVVNVEKNTECQFSVGNVYGGGNLAPYDSINHTNYPEVNIKHTGTSPNATTNADMVYNNVFGGGLGATAIVQGTPHVTIGDANGSHVVTVGNDVFGGGNAAQVTGSTNVHVKANATVGNNVYGGGNAAAVTGNTNVKIGD